MVCDIEIAIPASAIKQAIAKTKVEEKRHRALPAHLVVCLVIAMSIWSKDSMRDVLKNLMDGLSEAWIKIGNYWKFPCKSAITQARQRLGAGRKFKPQNFELGAKTSELKNWGDGEMGRCKTVSRLNFRSLPSLSP